MLLICLVSNQYWMAITILIVVKFQKIGQVNIRYFDFNLDNFN